MAISSPFRLWTQAQQETTDPDPAALQRRYRELMVEHGHLVKAEPGVDRNLPCGWPHVGGQQSEGDKSDD